MANICWRVTASLTGRCTWRAASAATIALRPGRALGAEAAADVGGDHADALGCEPEHLGDGVARRRRALGGLVEREVAVAPQRERGVRLHRVVVLRRGACRSRRSDRRGRRQPGLDVAALGVGLESRVDLVGLVEPRVVAAQLDVVGICVVVDAHEGGRLARDLEALGDGHGDDLAAVGDVAAAGGPRARGRRRRPARGAFSCAEHGEHAVDGRAPRRGRRRGRVPLATVDCTTARRPRPRRRCSNA